MQLHSLNPQNVRFTGKSYAYGCGGARKVLNVVEVYSPEANKWATITPMNSARCMAMAATF